MITRSTTTKPLPRNRYRAVPPRAMATATVHAHVDGLGEWGVAGAEAQGAGMGRPASAGR